MKSLYESLLTGKVSKPSAKVHPSSKKELQQLISEHIEEIKSRPGQEVDFNWIDISEVDNLSELFEGTNYIPVIDTWKIDQVKKFDFMFAGNKYIASSPLPRLQEKLLGPSCYAYMFLNCKSLKVAPKLPATELTEGCYRGMFEGCSLLKHAPQLPATKLVHECYAAMFQNCKDLKVAPELPATELAPHCYWHMFDGCTSLKVAPALPVTELTEGCYCGMFKGCSSLKVAPELPATELAPSCYEAMFKKCDNLKAKAKIPKNVHADQYDYYARSMYTGCPCENK